MVTNSTNICKTNSHLSPKLIEDNKKKDHDIMTLEIQVLACDMHSNEAGLNRVIGS